MQPVLRVEVVARVQPLVRVVALVRVEPLLREQPLVRAQTLGRQQLLVAQDAPAVRRHGVRRHGVRRRGGRHCGASVVLPMGPLWRQHTVLGHGPLNPSRTLPLGRSSLLLLLLLDGRLLVLLVLLLGQSRLATLGLLVPDHVKGQRVADGQVREVPFAAVVLVNVLVGCGGETEQSSGSENPVLLAMLHLISVIKLRASKFCLHFASGIR